MSDEQVKHKVLMNKMIAELSKVRDNPRRQVEIALSYLSTNRDLNFLVGYTVSLVWFDLVHARSPEIYEKLIVFDKKWNEECKVKPFLEFVLVSLTDNKDADKSILACAATIIMMRRRLPNYTFREAFKLIIVTGAITSASLN